MKVINVWDSHINHKTYGYCSCGREVRKDIHTECPLCGAKLEWEKAEWKEPKLIELEKER